MSEASNKRSEDFLKISDQFQLGVLTTEASHPLTASLSDVAKRDVSAALQRYEQTRKPRASRCQEGSRRNAVMYHLPDGDEQRKRDAGLASAADAPLPQNAWLYGHDVEAEFERR